MKASSRLTIVTPLASAMALFALSAQAQVDSVPHQPQPQRPAAQAPKAPPRAAMQGPRAADAVPGRPPGAGAGRGAPADARFYRGAPSARVYGGNPYRGRVAWEGGRWRHERHDGRDGWWWDVGGVWYYYPQAMDGPPTYISEDYADDIPVDAYGPPPGAYPPPQAGYAPPPPPPPEDPNPAAGAIGGAVVGGLLGGLLTGRASGAAAGALVGGTTGAIVGATAASRPGYYFSQGNCYYRYPSGQYAMVDQRACY